MLFRRRRRRRWRSKLRDFLIKLTVSVMVIATVVGGFLQWISTLELTDNHVRALWILVGLIFLVIAAIEVRHIIERGITPSTPKKASNGGKREKVERFWRDRKPEDRNKHGAPFDMKPPEDGAYWGHADYWKAAQKARKQDKATEDPDEYIGDVGIGRAITKWFERRTKR